MKQQDSNTFGGGLNTDMNYLSLPKDVLKHPYLSPHIFRLELEITTIEMV